MGKIIRLGATLCVFCVVSAGLLAWVYLLTTPLIEANARAAFEASLKEVLPGAERFREVSAAGAKHPVYAGYAAGRAVGLAVRTTPRGYAGEIVMLVGVDPELRILGLKILSHRETPGLGANVQKPKFLAQFIGMGSDDLLEPKKDIDAITGATISSRAICEGVRQALEESRVPGGAKP